MDGIKPLAQLLIGLPCLLMMIGVIVGVGFSYVMRRKDAPQEK